MAEIIAYIVIFLLFCIGSFNNFKTYKRAVYPARLTKPVIAFMVIGFLILVVIAHTLNYPSWYTYPIILAALMFILSGSAGEGIHEEGIYFRPSGRGNFMRLAEWKDIKDVNFDSEKAKLESFEVSDAKMSPNQYFKHEDVDNIKSFINKKV